MVLLLPHILSAFACTVLYPVIESVSAKKINRNYIETLQRQATDRFHNNKLAVSLGGVDVKSDPGVKNFTFSEPIASGECLPRTGFWNTCEFAWRC